MNAPLTPRFISAPFAQVLFHGRPSQAIHLMAFIAALAIVGVSLMAAMLWVLPWWLPTLPGVIALAVLGWRALATACTTIAIDEDRLVLRTGVLTKTVSSMELFRMLDITLVHPWWQRLLGIGTLVIHANDASHPRLELEGMPQAEWLRDTLNRAVIDCRERKGMRELTMGYV